MSFFFHKLGKFGQGFFKMNAVSDSSAFDGYCIKQQLENKDGKRNNKKVAPNKPKLMLLSVSVFCPFFKQQVSEHTRLFFDGHKEHFFGFSPALS